MMNDKTQEPTLRAPEESKWKVGNETQTVWALQWQQRQSPHKHHSPCCFYWLVYGVTEPAMFTVSHSHTETYIQKQQMNSSQWRNKLSHCNGVVVLPVIGLLKPIIIWGGGHWNYLGIPYPRAERPEVVADLHCFCHSSRKSPLKADSPWAIVERAKAENYRLSGKRWKIRPRERKK